MNRLTTAVVIASYNQDAYIRSAVESAAADADHVIVVDDCSTDNSVSEIRSVQAQNVTVVVRESRSGVSEAFNLGVRASNEDLVLFQGGDDLTLRHRSRAHRKALEDSSVSLSIATPCLIAADGSHLPGSAALEFSLPPANVDPLAHLFYVGNFICAPSAAVRREDYLRWGGFAPGIDLLQDYKLWLQALAEGSLHISPEPLVAYRKHFTNTSRSYTGIDSSRRRRHAAELEYVLTEFAEVASDQALSRLAAHVGIGIEPAGEAERDAIKGLVLLSHPSRVVQRRGLHLLFRVAASDDGRAVLRTCGLSLVDLGTLAHQVDHEDLGDIHRAVVALGSLPKQAGN